MNNDAPAPTSEPASEPADDELGPVGDALFDASEFGEEVVEESVREVFAATARSASYDTQDPLRLERVRLKRALGFEDVDIELDDFKVLVGANNSGKSSLMRAIAFAQILLKVHVDRVDAHRVLLARGRNLADGLLPVPEVRDLYERELSEQFERAYRRLVSDWQQEPKKKGAGATRGRASRGPSSGQAARQGSAPEPAL